MAMETAHLVAQNVPQFCPVTNHYQCSDGRHLLVTLCRLDVASTITAVTGITVPILRSHLPTGVDVFLSDEHQTVLDADGDPSNGMTPLAQFDVDSHEAALAALGYQVTEEA